MLAARLLILPWCDSDDRNVIVNFVGRPGQALHAPPAIGTPVSAPYVHTPTVGHARCCTGGPDKAHQPSEAEFRQDLGEGVGHEICADISCGSPAKLFARPLLAGPLSRSLLTGAVSTTGVGSRCWKRRSLYMCADQGPLRICTCVEGQGTLSDPHAFCSRSLTKRQTEGLHKLAARNLLHNVLWSLCHSGQNMRAGRRKSRSFIGSHFFHIIACSSCVCRMKLR